MNHAEAIVVSSFDARRISERDLSAAVNRLAEAIGGQRLNGLWQAADLGVRESRQGV